LGRILIAVSFALAVALVSAAPASAGVAVGAPVQADFNGDGTDDLAVGIPGEDIDATTDAGAVQVIYGTVGGLARPGNQFFHQDVPGIGDIPEEGDEFGRTLTGGDFNGDGRDDLAVGVPFEEVGGVGAAGAVQVLYGTAAGLSAAGDQLWHQGESGIFGEPEVGDFFGLSVSSGDFNADGRGDLAVGIRDEDGDVAVNVGAVQVIYGTIAGLDNPGNQLWHQDVSGIFDEAEEGDEFGNSLAVGDFNGDGRADLAAGVQNEDLDGAANAGAVHVLYGSTGGGLARAGNQLWHQDVSNANGVVYDSAEAGDGFGHTVAAGDFNGNGTADLAAGVTFEDLGALGDAGAVQVLYGAFGGGLTPANNQLWHQDESGIYGDAEASDFFGLAVGAGDFNGDGRAELATGILSDDSVQVLYGTAVGLHNAGNQLWSQDVDGVVDSSEGDLFGFSFSTANFGNGPQADLAIGVPNEGIAATEGAEETRCAGAVHVLYGSIGGLTPNGNQLWHQNVSGIYDDVEQDDSFGQGLFSRSAFGIDCEPPAPTANQVYRPHRGKVFGPIGGESFRPR
jgi:disulfide bond formation protein DsbB